MLRAINRHQKLTHEGQKSGTWRIELQRSAKKSEESQGAQGATNLTKGRFLSWVCYFAERDCAFGVDKGRFTLLGGCWSCRAVTQPAKQAPAGGARTATAPDNEEET